ncbi:hypothetical protein [Pasteurella multocida]|uniref:hypothetical protein n=1 Tax=Pasteurella multocida TaxID=747 RepID=UPI00292CE97A|nr:hypothetical protein [Pasteurella multocida]WNY75948.1 hypothetical protein H2513_08700 [Pasteurella multocida]
MNKYVLRVYGMVEIKMEAESIEQAIEQCDLNILDLNKLPHQITEINEVIEAEEL